MSMPVLYPRRAAGSLKPLDHAGSAFIGHAPAAHRRDILRRRCAINHCGAAQHAAFTGHASEWWRFLLSIGLNPAQLIPRGGFLFQQVLQQLQQHAGYQASDDGRQHAPRAKPAERGKAHRQHKHADDCNGAIIRGGASRWLGQKKPQVVDSAAGTGAQKEVLEQVSHNARLLLGALMGRRNWSYAGLRRVTPGYAAFDCRLWSACMPSSISCLIASPWLRIRFENIQSSRACTCSAVVRNWTRSSFLGRLSVSLMPSKVCASGSLCNMLMLLDLLIPPWQCLSNLLMFSSFTDKVST